MQTNNAQPLSPEAVPGSDDEMTAQDLPMKAYRMDPATATAQDLHALKGLSEDKAERKLKEVRNGATLAAEMPPFPETPHDHDGSGSSSESDGTAYGKARPMRDVMWIVPFFLTVVCVITGVFIYASEIKDYYHEEVMKKRAQAGSSKHDSINIDSIESLVGAGLAGAAASLVAATLFAYLANKAPACVVYTSLLFSPCLLIALGLGIMFFGDAGSLLIGACLVLLGVLSLGCTFCCYRSLIPFMIKVLETITSVMRNHPMMILVSVGGSFVGILWAVLCGVFFVGVSISGKHKLDSTSEDSGNGLYFVCVFIFGWGAQVVHNVCHMTYCGVYGRWYYGLDNDAPIRKSLMVSLTTSFGSICFGSFLIAFIRAVEAVIRAAKQDAASNQNIVACIILAILQCVVACIGDILEYFSEWAYVQCAIRGCSFMDAARITYSMMTAANLQYIISDLLLNSVVNMGALFCAIVGGGVGAGVGASVSTDCAIAGGIIGLLSGAMAGGTAIGILGSGTKAVLTLWAENPVPLQNKRPKIHALFEARILKKM